MTVRKLAVCTAMFLLLASMGVEAFDGNRKGFVVGFGAGVAPVAKFSTLSGSSQTTLSGFSFNLMVGHGLSSKDMLVWSTLGASHPSSAFTNRYFAVQGISGIQWFHFMSRKKQSIYTSIGIGVMVFQSSEGSDRRSGVGYKGEIGYLVEKHLMIGAYGILGETGRGEYPLRHQQFGILLRILAY